jgi:hypothetical protein
MTSISERNVTLREILESEYQLLVAQIALATTKNKVLHDLLALRAAIDAVITQRAVLTSPDTEGSQASA